MRIEFWREVPTDQITVINHNVILTNENSATVLEVDVDVLVHKTYMSSLLNTLPVLYEQHHRQSSVSLFVFFCLESQSIVP